MESNICKPCKPKSLCQEGECKKRSYYNFKDKPAMYCRGHKKQGMFNVIDKLCEEEDCEIRAIFNFKGLKNGIYCTSHKKQDMINVIDKKCQQQGCEKIPFFNFKDKKGGVFCTEHKQDGMVNVKDKKCQEQGCETIPFFNFKGLKIGIYCTDHKKQDMINVKDKKCQEGECGIIPFYNFRGLKNGIYCTTHKKENMVNVKDKMCHTPICETKGNKKYEGYCLFCFINTFPDKPISRNYKTKEKAVCDYIKEQFNDFTLVFDKKAQNGCSKRRPDILLDLGYQVIIVEIDENQHEDYSEICENKRTMEISQDLGYRPVIFIRFNPDAYTLPSGNVTSCWSPNKLGILTVKKCKQNEWLERLQKLKETVNFWVNNVSEKTVNTVHLFYDKLN
jgi:hypothetical protein